MRVSREDYLHLLNKSHPSKYHNKAVVIDGIRFASKKEGNRYISLKMMAEQGKIGGLQLQPVFKFPPGFSYRADFQYQENKKQIVEDVKGIQTPEFRLKKKCFEYFYPQLELRIT